MDIFKGGPRGKFFEILSAEGPASAQNETTQAQSAQSPVSGSAKRAALARKSPDASSRKIGPLDGLNDEFCR
nr:hypothetical protein [uncultured Campylobacter sp.]